VGVRTLHPAGLARTLHPVGWARTLHLVGLVRTLSLGIEEEVIEVENHSTSLRVPTVEEENDSLQKEHYNPPAVVLEGD